MCYRKITNDNVDHIFQGWENWKQHLASNIINIIYTFIYKLFIINIIMSQERSKKLLNCIIKVSQSLI